jgi:hypothetical protein
MKPALIKKFLEQIRLVRPPKKVLSTFGATRIQYHLVSPVDDLPDKTRLREGWVVSEKPKILTPDALTERFDGFGEDAPEFTDFLNSQYRDLLRALEYTFKNQDFKTRVLAQKPASTSDNIIKDVNERDIPQAAVIECPDAAWSLALMRFTLDNAARSFPTNVQDLDNHGLFQPGSNEARRKRNEIESLFERAKRDSDVRKLLGVKLREYGLFPEFEDRFLALYR